MFCSSTMFSRSGVLALTNLDARAVPAAASLLLTGFLVSTAAAQPAQYTAELLGPGIVINDMNEAGAVVGWTTLDGQIRGFVCGPNQPYTLLPFPPGYNTAWAQGINDAGVIVGSVGANGTYPEFGQSVVWTPDGDGGFTTEFLGQLPGHNSSVATAINNHGDIVGFSIVPGFQGGPAVLFTAPDGLVNLGALGFTAQPQAINNQRQIVGGQLRMDLDTMVVEDLGLPHSPPNWWWTVASAINENGQVAGHARLATSLNNNRRIARFTDGIGWEILDFSPGQYSHAYGINDAGDVSLELWGAGIFGSYVYLEDHGLYQIEDLLALESSGWSFSPSFGNSINNAGQIALTGQDNTTGQSGVVLLTPIVDAIIPGDLNGDGLVNVTDLLMLLSAWGDCPGMCAADLNGDGTVNVADLLQLLANWG